MRAPLTGIGSVVEWETLWGQFQNLSQVPGSARLVLRNPLMSMQLSTPAARASAQPDPKVPLDHPGSYGEKRHGS